MSARGVLIGLLALCSGALAMAPVAAAGRHGARHGVTKVQLTTLLAAAQAQQRSQDLVAARASLEQAYALQPSPAVLCALGALAAADGRPLEALDARRRCSAAGEPIATGAGGAAGPLPDSGELSVTGAHHALVYVDAHVVGALPLALPLLLAPGPHQLQLVHGARRVSTAVEVLAGRAALLTMTGKPTVKPLPAVALLVDFGPGAAAAPLLQQAATQAVQAQHLGVLGQWGGLGEKFAPGGCADAPCAQSLAQRHRLRYVVAARATSEPDGWQLWTQLFDAEVGDVASEQASSCEHCTLDQASARLGELLTTTLRTGQSRPTGIMEITSTPPGGDVLMGGLRLGQTPLRRAAFAGEHAIVVQRAGYAPYQNEVVVEPGRGAALDATLRATSAAAPPAATASTMEPASPRGSDQTPGTTLPPPSPGEPALALAPPPSEPLVRDTGTRRALALPTPGRAARPRWRVGLGAALTTVGAVFLGFGITGLAVDGRCTQSPVAAATGELCPSGRVVNSSGTGAALLATGLVTVGVGATLWALPGARPPELSPAAPTAVDHAAAGGSF